MIRAPRSPLDNNDGDWWYIFSTTRKPFVWESYTVKPISLDNYTPSPKDHEFHIGPGNPGPVVTIFLVFIIVGILAILFLFCYRCRTRSSTQSTNNDSHMVLPTAPALHTFEQPRYTVDFSPHPVYRPYIPNQPLQVYGATNDQPAQMQRDTTSNSRLNRGNTSEKPPGYGEVVQSDLDASHKYPEVKSSVPETPPPKYFEENLLKY